MEPQQAIESIDRIAKALFEIDNNNTNLNSQTRNELQQTAAQLLLLSIQADSKQYPDTLSHQQWWLSVQDDYIQTIALAQQYLDSFNA